MSAGSNLAPCCHLASPPKLKRNTFSSTILLFATFLDDANESIAIFCFVENTLACDFPRWFVWQRKKYGICFLNLKPLKHFSFSIYWSGEIADNLLGFKKTFWFVSWWPKWKRRVKPLNRCIVYNLFNWIICAISWRKKSFYFYFSYVLAQLGEFKKR